jgi:hypothetical protein
VVIRRGVQGDQSFSGFRHVASMRSPSSTEYP